MYYVYKFLDKNNNIIYIGKTKNLNRRMYDHLNNNGHLNEECYKSINSILYCIFNNINDMNLFEIFCISKYNPKYNKVYLTTLKLKFEIIEPDWIIFDIKSLEHYKINSKGNGKVSEIKDSNIVKKLEEYIISKDYRYSTQNKRNYCLFCFGISIETSIINILNIKISDLLDINKDINSVITIKDGISERYNSFEINDSLSKAIKEYLNSLNFYNENDYLFSSRQKNSKLIKYSEESKPLTPNQAWRIINQLGKELKLDINLGASSLKKTIQYKNQKELYNI